MRLSSTVDLSFCLEICFLQDIFQRGYLHLIPHFHDFRVPFTFSKMCSDACIRINSHAEVTESGFITDLLLFILVAIYNNRNIENVLVRILILKILN